jgi:hypothetical protein
MIDLLDTETLVLGVRSVRFLSTDAKADVCTQSNGVHETDS